MSQEESYLVLARKYRPQNFDEVMGQEVLVRTLTNAIKNNRLHHAYILTGIRGVGKTTTARIIAKTLNCLDENSSKNGKSCGVCNNCKSIALSRHQDVIEIDAASRTGVDDMREIIDSIAYAPVMAKYKIYIIDEVHMLSNSAFNALLKTLEEPPAHVKFIFATTEIKKVPVTILSRCQRFDLRRLDESEIFEHLKNILQKENFEFEDGALKLIAKMSEGSVRDSLSLADQALSANNHEKKLTVQVVETMLGLNDKNKIVELLDVLLSGDYKQSYEKFNEIYAYSCDISQILSSLMEVVHLVMKNKVLQEEFDEAMSDNAKQKIKEIAQKISVASLARIWQMLLKGSSEMNFSHAPKISFEMLMLRICHLSEIADLGAILSKIDTKNVATQNNDEKKLAEKKEIVKDMSEDEIAHEILRNFSGAKIINEES
jgi:DNA polymerase-3 subunit gamma/tau